MTLEWEDASEGGGQSAEWREQRGSGGGVRQRLRHVVLDLVWSLHVLCGCDGQPWRGGSRGVRRSPLFFKSSL